jgi:hypothetical protein
VLVLPGNTKIPTGDIADGNQPRCNS